MKIIKLTERDHDVLMMMLGFALSLATTPPEVIDRWKEVSDWIFIQAGPSTYTYFHDGEELKKRKEAELEGAS